MVICYVDNVLVIHKHPKIIIEGLKRTFRLMGDKAESPTMYFGATLLMSVTEESIAYRETNLVVKKESL